VINEEENDEEQFCRNVKSRKLNY